MEDEIVDLAEVPALVAGWSSGRKGCWAWFRVGQ